MMTGRHHQVLASVQQVKREGNQKLTTERGSPRNTVLYAPKRRAFIIYHQGEHEERCVSLYSSVCNLLP